MSTFQEAVRLLCESDEPDDIVRACMYIQKVDVLSRCRVVWEQLGFKVLPRLLSILADPPVNDGEDWLIYWAIMAVKNVCLLPSVMRLAIRLGALGIVSKWIDVINQTITEASFHALHGIVRRHSRVFEGEDLDRLWTDSRYEGGGLLDDQQIGDEFAMVFVKSLQFASDQLQQSRLSRHPGLLQASLWATLALIDNWPGPVALNLARACPLAAALVEHGDPNVDELIIDLVERIVHGVDPALQADAATLARQMVVRLARQDLGNRAGLELLLTIMEKFGAVWFWEAGGIKAMANILPFISHWEGVYQKALLTALNMINQHPDGNHAAYEAMVTDGLFRAASQTLTEELDDGGMAEIPVRQASLEFVDKLIRHSPLPVYKKMQVDVNFVLSLLAQVQPGEERAALNKQITDLILWMDSTNRIDLEQIANGSVGRRIAVNIPSGDKAIELAGKLLKQLKDEQRSRYLSDEDDAKR